MASDVRVLIVNGLIQRGFELVDFLPKSEPIMQSMPFPEEVIPYTVVKEPGNGEPKLVVHTKYATRAKDIPDLDTIANYIPDRSTIISQSAQVKYNGFERTLIYNHAIPSIRRIDGDDNFGVLESDIEKQISLILDAFVFYHFEHQSKVSR